jgi:hypothetical protein
MSWCLNFGIYCTALIWVLFGIIATWDHSHRDASKEEFARELRWEWTQFFVFILATANTTMTFFIYAMKQGLIK